MNTDQQNYKYNDMPQSTSIDDSNVATLTKTKIDVSSNLHKISAKDMVNVNMIGNARWQRVEITNTTFQHKTKPKDAVINNNINHTIVETSNGYDGNVITITITNEGGKKIVASGNINDEEIVKDTKKYYD